ncbi:unnamed protein product [Arctogadus glacialis]
MQAAGSRPMGPHPEIDLEPCQSSHDQPVENVGQLNEDILSALRSLPVTTGQHLCSRHQQVCRVSLGGSDSRLQTESWWE